MQDDRQLRVIRLKDVLEKRRLDQALNAKEFAVLAGISYSMAREWFHLPGFPVFRGVIFWQDFARWRMEQNGLANAGKNWQKPVRKRPEQPACHRVLRKFCSQRDN